MEQTNANTFEGSEWPDQDEDFGEFEEEQASPWDWWDNVWYDAAWMAGRTTPPILQIPGFGQHIPS